MHSLLVAMFMTTGRGLYINEFHFVPAFQQLNSFEKLKLNAKRRGANGVNIPGSAELMTELKEKLEERRFVLDENAALIILYDAPKSIEIEIPYAIITSDTYR